MNVHHHYLYHRIDGLVRCQLKHAATKYQQRKPHNMVGRILLTLDAIALIVAAPMADYNETHIFNPRWPPHAK